MIPTGTSPAPMRAWLQSVRPGLATTVICPREPDTSSEVDVAVPTAQLLGPAAARLVEAPLGLLAAVEEVAVRTTSRWRAESVARDGSRG